MKPALHIEVDGAEVDGESGADHRPTLVLVNGARCTVRQWDRLIAPLTAGHRVIRHDVRGTGSSGPGPPGEYRFERYADDLIELCRERGVDRFDLWGMAWGARVALVTAARHPETVDRLVLSDLAIDPADAEAQRDGARQAKAARAEAGIPEVPNPDGAFDQLDPEETARALAATQHHPDLMPFVRRVRAPTLIATGEFDPNLTSSRRALAGFEKAELTVLAKTGHASVLQRPDLVLERVSAFLTGR